MTLNSDWGSVTGGIFRDLPSNIVTWCGDGILKHLILYNHPPELFLPHSSVGPVSTVLGVPWHYSAPRRWAYQTWSIFSLGFEGFMAQLRMKETRWVCEKTPKLTSMNLPKYVLIIFFIFTLHIHILSKTDTVSLASTISSQFQHDSSICNHLQPSFSTFFCNYFFHKYNPPWNEQLRPWKWVVSWFRWFTFPF